MGLGVRLGLASGKQGLLPKEADGQRRKSTHIRGTSIRMRTDFGKSPNIPAAQDVMAFSKWDLEDPIRTLVPGRLRQMDTGSAASFALLKRWLNACNNHHKYLPLSTPLPDRVIEALGAQGEPNIRLKEMKGNFGQYIALSHCWGVAASLRTLIAISTISSKQYHLILFQRL
jgi:hypothetical protein